MAAVKKSFVFILLALCFGSDLLAADCVVLLHGLARTSNSLNKIADALEDEGYVVANIDYPSRAGTIAALAAPAIETGLSACNGAGTDQVSFVTHSLGGILVRYYLEKNVIERLHRVVMLAPPNQGSEVVDAFKNIPGYKLLNGPAGLQLGKGEESIPLQLDAVDFDLGIIAGNRTINLLLSQFLDNPDDGKVSVVSTRVAGMCGFIELPVSHAMMMRNDQVIAQVLSFLAYGKFSGENAEVDLCQAPRP